MDSKFTCDACNKTFTQKFNLVKHSAKCDVKKYIGSNLTHNDNKQNEILQFKLDEANNIIEDDEKQIEELNKIINEKQNLINILQTKLDMTDKLLEEREKMNDKLLEEKSDEIKHLRRYYEYFMTGNNNTMKDLCSIIKLDKEPAANTANNANNNAGTNTNGTSHNANTNANNNTNTSTSTSSIANSNNVTVVLNNYTPSAIQPIDQLIDIKETLNQYINLFELWSKEKIFHRKLGDIIISNYQETDPSEQKVWCTDVNRFVYYIRTVENSEHIAGRRQNIKEIWENDKGGVKVSKYIIEPVLTCLDTLLKTWLFNNDRTKDAGMHVLTKMGLVANILELISTGELNKMILQYISNYFSITKTGQSVPIKPTSNLKCIKKEVPLPSSESEPESSDEPESEIENEDLSDESDEDNKKKYIKKRRSSSSDESENEDSSDESDDDNKKRYIKKRQSSSSDESDEDNKRTPRKKRSTRKN